MTNYEKFVIWLSGFADLNGGKPPTKEQWELINERLAETFDTPAPASPGYAKGGLVEKKPENYGLWSDAGGGVAVAKPAVQTHFAGVGTGIRTMELRPGDISVCVNSAQATADSALASRVGSIATTSARIETETSTRAR